MKNVWRRRVIDSPAVTLWELLTDLDRWPRWGPTVQAADLTNGRFERGATGVVTTIGGIGLDFEIVEFEPGVRWRWSVAGIPATDHVVEPLGPSACRVGIGVPWPAAAYLVVCEVALRRLERLAAETDWESDRPAASEADREDERSGP